MKTHGSHHWLIIALTAGCGAAADVPSEPAAPSAAPVVTESPDSRKLLASVRKSTTQTINFWEHSHGVVQIEDTGSIDQDLRGEAAGRQTLVQTNIDGMSLVDAYKLLAGPAAEQASIATLAEVDGRLGKLNPVAPAQGGGVADTGMLERSSGPPRQSVSPLNLTQCQQTANSWNWPNDIAWFKNTFCGNDSVTCFANANYGWVDSSAWYTYQNSWFHATGFEGSFCDTATFHYTLKLEGCDSSTIIWPNVYTLNPRYYNTQNWYTSGCVFRADWDAQVDGNWSGQDFQLRLGLAVHRQ